MYVGTQHVSLNIPAVPVDTQDVFAGKLDVAVSIQLKLQLHDAIYRLRFYSNLLIHI